MFTSLDLLIIVFMALAAVTLISLALMFLIRNNTARRICFYVSSALGVYISWVGFRIGLGGMFPLRIAIGILTALACVGAFVLERVRKDNSGLFLVARLLTAASLMIGIFNAIL